MTRRASGLLAAAALALVTLPIAAAGASPRAAIASSAGSARVPAAPHRASGRDSAPSSRASPAPAVAPGGPALSTAPAGEGSEEEASETVQGSTDPLVGNGLGSPLCRGTGPELQLSASARRNCATSGFVASAAPTANYGLDVHIDTGVLGLSHGGLMSALQDLLVTPLWMALVWVVHALCVMLEWCFTLNLLDSPASGGVGRGLREMQQALTEPWIPTVLAVACVLVVYDGLVRRRVADTLGQTLLMAAMMAAGLWAVADPGGTVGALGSWANEASLGTLAAAASGTSNGTPQALGQSMQVVFSTAIEVPWCYLEFGNVRWCREPVRTEPRLRAAALKIAAEELAQAGCSGQGARAANGGACAGGAGGKDEPLLQSARLLREADSNGAIFLALPANGPQRNSINDEGSLLRTICQSSDATNCRGPAAAEAEFRTSSQTWSRLAGLLLIALGALGMILLLAFIALRLLSAALFSLFYLLIAPGMVLAPALGEGGRAVFRRWATHLLGAVISKLLFSFLLGVVLAVLAILASLSALGWWTQWLLMSAFWWGAFTRRHQVLGFAEGAVGRREVPRPREPRSLTRRVSDALESRKGMAAARWVKRRREGAPPETRPVPPSSAPLRSLPRAGSRPAAPGRRDPPRAAPREDARHGALSQQLARVRRERAGALSTGEDRRAAELAAREVRVEGELKAEEERGTSAGRPPVPAAARPHRPDGGTPSAAQAAHRPPPADRSPGSLERRRRARLEIDHEIDLHRRRAGQGPAEVQSSSPSSSPPTGERPASTPGAGGRARRGAPDVPRQDQESSVMRDVREVQARRKRFLGTDRP